MRRVGVKRAFPEPPHNHRGSSPPAPKRARLSGDAQPRSTGVFRTVVNWFHSVMSAVSGRLSRSTRAQNDEDSVSTDSFEPCSQDQEATGPLLISSQVTTGPTSSMAPPPVSTSQPLNTSTSVDHPNHTSINQQSRFKPHSSSTVAKNRHRSLLKPSRKPPPPSQTPRTLFSPVVTTPPNLSPAIRTFAKPQTTPYYPTHPLSSTPYTSSQQSSSHNHGHSETGSQRPFTPLLPPISFNTSDKAGSSKTEKKAVEPKRPPARTKSAIEPARISEMNEWLQDLRLSSKDAQSDRLVEVELTENRLRTCRAERMVLENERVTRLRSLLTSPCPQEPDKITFDLSPDERKRVTMATRGGPGGECVSSAFNISLTRIDLCTFVGLNWLNDNVVNFYFNMIRDAHPKVHVMSSFFYPKLSQSGYTSVRRWTKKVDIFSMELVLFPIHLGMHWCLAAADFKTSTLTYYDSLLGNNSSCLPRIKKYLEDESENKKGVRLDFSSWSQVIAKKIPTQENGSDCGVFMCLYARHLSEGLPFSFHQRDFPKIREYMMFEILEKRLRG
ncbi:sentrin-specific protease 1-like isoform X2 [Halichondria panicea]|uniref:sentrin-specific protease 1-like isoform X2 n=1 Tax=Halichondria panicea TaxID=6063 RepID=UPI00312B32F3